MKLGKVIGVGATAEVYEYDDRVLKLFYSCYDKNYVKWEYDKTKNAYDCGLPAVKVYEIVEYKDRYGIVMDKVEGESLQSIMLAPLFSKDKADISSLEKDLHTNMKTAAETISKIHKADSSVMDSLERVTITTLNSVEDLSGKEKSKVISIIKSIEGRRCICHGDPNPGNIIITKDGPIFIDWMNCIMAPPLYDAANIFVMYKYLSLPPDIPKEAADYILSIKDMMNDIFLDEYKKINDFNQFDFDKLVVIAMVIKLSSNMLSDLRDTLVNDIKAELTKYEDR